MFSPAPSRLLLRIECWCTRGERSPSHMLQTAAHRASCLNRIFKLDNNDSCARLIHWNPWTYSPAGLGARTLIYGGSPVAHQSRLNPLFQIEKNISKERVTKVRSGLRRSESATRAFTSSTFTDAHSASFSTPSPVPPLPGAHQVFSTSGD